MALVSAFAAGFLAVGFFAGALEVDFSEALVSAVFEVALEAEPLPLVAVSFAFGFAAGFFAAEREPVLAAGFLAAGFFAAGFFACAFFSVSFFSSAISLSLSL